MRRPFAIVALVLASTAAAAAPKAAPTLSAAKVIDASAAGAVVAATCGRGSADEHRRNAQAAARQMLQAQHMLPSDFDARFLRAWKADAAGMQKLKPAQRRTVCTRLEAQGMHFRR